LLLLPLAFTPLPTHTIASPLKHTHPNLNQPQSAKLLAELPVGAFFPLVFGSVVYPLCGLNPNPARCAWLVARGC